ncbi:hypothetical protein JCM6882_001005 [Rhodosporidiobolus microsporus]
MSRAMSSLIRSAARPSASAPRAARSTLRSRQASSHAHAESSSEVYPQEGFNAPFWRWLSLAGVGVFVYSRAAPVHLAPKDGADLDEQPWLTRYIAYNLAPSADKWKARNDKHLELAKEAADDKLLFQEAERSRMRRMRYLGTFDQASPNGIEVGSQADLSDLVIKSEKDDFAA